MLALVLPLARGWTAATADLRMPSVRMLATSRSTMSRMIDEARDPRSERPERAYTDAFRTLGDVTLSPIGHVESPYKERFGTPRQPTVTNYTTGGVAQEGTIVLRPDLRGVREVLSDLEGFSHLWVICHLHLNTGWKAKVMPPRGPKRRRGLFATRAPHRPNQIGLSAVEITSVDVKGGRVGIRGLDILDGTPVLDVKPYLPYCDSFPTARAGWIDEIDGPGGAAQADRLEYWPPPPHLKPADSDVGDEGGDER